MAHGEFGAQGRPSWELLSEALDRLVSYRKGWKAQLRYLDTTRGGAAELAAEGLVPTRRQRNHWASGGQPNKANQAAIMRAYRRLRSRNVIRILTRRLEAGGGTRVEIHPEGQQSVSRPHRRDLNVRDINVRRWARIIQAWATGDTLTLQAEWETILEDLGSDWNAYLFASSVGIQAT